MFDKTSTPLVSPSGSKRTPPLSINYLGLRSAQVLGTAVQKKLSTFLCHQCFYKL